MYDAGCNLIFLSFPLLFAGKLTYFDNWEEYIHEATNNETRQGIGAGSCSFIWRNCLRRNDGYGGYGPGG